MRGHFYKKYCKCPKNRKCTCGAKWYFAIDIGIDPKTGKRKQLRKGGFATRKEAELEVAKIIKELSDGTFVKESDITFRQFAQDWLKMYEASGKNKPNTILIRRYSIKKLLEYFSELRIRDITQRKYQDMLFDLKKRNYSESTIIGINATGKMIFKKAIELELIKKDPTKFVVIPRKQKTIEDIELEKEIPKYLEKNELLRFLETIKKHGTQLEYCIFLVLAYTGMRVGELIALKWSDIDFEEKTISITKTYFSEKKRTKEYQLIAPKTKSSIRMIDVDEYVISELKKLRMKQNEIKIKYRNIYHDENFVFAEDNPDFFGFPIPQKKILLKMKRFLLLAKLDTSYTPHSLRHTHTSLLAEAGVTLEEIMERLGHKSDVTTRNVYLHITKRRKKEVAQKFSELMRTP